MLIAQAYGYKAIAEKLHMSIKTVKVHVAKITDKWQLDRTKTLTTQITLEVLLHCDKQSWIDILLSRHT